MKKEINNNILTLMYIFFALLSSFILPDSFESVPQTILIFLIAFMIHLIIKERYKKLIFVVVIATILYLILIPTISISLIGYLLSLYAFILLFLFDILILSKDSIYEKK